MADRVEPAPDATEEERRLIIEAAKESRNLKEVQDKTGLRLGTVRRVLADVGLMTNPEYHGKPSGKRLGYNVDPVVVIEMRNRYANGTSARALADEFGLSQGGVYKIVRGITRQDVPGPISEYRYGPDGKRPGHSARTLTDEQVEHIRETYSRERNLTALCKEFGLSPASMYAILDGKTYANVGGPIRKPDPMHSKTGLRALTEDQARDIRYRAAEGETHASLAREYGVSPFVVSSVVNRRTYRDVV